MSRCKACGDSYTEGCPHRMRQIPRRFNQSNLLLWSRMLDEAVAVAGMIAAENIADAYRPEGTR